VTASVLTDSNGSRLVLRGQSGSSNAFTLTTTDAALQSFAYGSGGGMTLGQAAQDSKFSVDSVAFTRSSNTIGDVIPGVTLTLKKAAPGASIGISSTRPTEALRTTVQDFVSVFNTLKKDIAAARTATGGDSSLRSLDQQLSGLLSTTLSSDANVKRLSDVGISTTRDGSISVDAAKFEKALTNSPDAVEALFSPTRDATHSAATDPGIALALQQLNDSVTGSSGILQGLKTRLDNESQGITKDQAAMEDREATYRSRLEKQFGTLDARISALKATQSYLEQQVKVWTNSNN
jgi:flagellar hook-associated protein 2